MTLNADGKHTNAFYILPILFACLQGGSIVDISDLKEHEALIAERDRNSKNEGFRRHLHQDLRMANPDECPLHVAGAILARFMEFVKDFQGKHGKCTKGEVQQERIIVEQS